MHASQADHSNVPLIACSTILSQIRQVPPAVMGFAVHSKDYILSANSVQLASSFANSESVLLENFNGKF